MSKVETCYNSEENSVFISPKVRAKVVAKAKIELKSLEDSFQRSEAIAKRNTIAASVKESINKDINLLVQECLNLS